MILRAIFWMAVVALVAPQVLHTSAACDRTAAECSAGTQLLARIRTESLHSLAQVRGQIEADERARDNRG